MAWSLDARIPLLVVTDATAAGVALREGPPAAILTDTSLALSAGLVVADACFSPGASHTASCACCIGRSQASVALDRLFQARIRGQSGWFERVVAVALTEAGQLEVAEALAADRLVSARYRRA